MSYAINVLNPSLTVVGTLSNIKNAEIYEVINNQYVADVEIVENTFPSFLQYPNMLEIDNDYFMIADIDKQRDNSKSIKLSLEHISYKLNDPSLAPYIPVDENGETLEEFYEGDIYQVIGQIWGGINQFTIGTNVAGYFYYRPSAKGGRSRIQEFARQNGLEVEYNKFSIYIWGRRGANKGLELRVGENVRSVSQKITLNDEFYIEYAHEVDIIDFSKMPGQYHAAIASADIGDTVRIIDTDLAIDALERIVAKRYNPMFKQIPKLDVGQVMRDIVNVINEKDEDKEQKEDPAANYFLRNWTIGDVNCMELSGIELDEDEVLPDGISANINYYIQGEKKSMSLAVKSQYSNYYVYIGEWYEDNTYVEYQLSDVASSIGTWELPKPKMQAISVTVSEVPLESFNPAQHKLRDYGIKFNKAYIEPLREFKIGRHNLLASNTTVDTEDGNIEIDDFKHTITYNLMEENEGVKLSLNREYSNYKIYITIYNSEGNTTTYDYDAIKDQLANWKLPRLNAEYLLVTVQEKPNAEFNPAQHKKIHYGIKFEQVPIAPLYSCKIGAIECLNLSGFEVAQSPALNEIQCEIFYEELDELDGLNITLKRDYRTYKVYITTYNNKGVATSRDYDSIKNWTFPRKTVMYMYIEILEVERGEFNPTKHRRAQYAVRFTQRDNDLLDPLGPQDYLEYETVTAAAATFMFENAYDELISVTTGIGQHESEGHITAYWQPIEEDEKIIGIDVTLQGDIDSDVKISIQAVCRLGVEEDV
ncbi:hypothetical protein A0U40_09865 [[Bacillus] sp. KCTC 13219]|nr:hypothetical protein A0U40_09865 [[Bacillus] sp. KCTC 13219]